MPEPVVLASADLPSLISVAVTPVALITTTAILLGSFTTKHNNLAVQLRALSTELRNQATDARRQGSLKRQIRLFLRRIKAIWSACACLYLALIAFVGMVIAVLAVERFPRITPLGFAALLIGLILIGLAVGFELYELYLARLTLEEEVDELQI